MKLCFLKLAFMHRKTFAGDFQCQAGFEAVCGNQTRTIAHGFDNQNNEERSREIIRAAIEFIKTRLENKARVTTKTR